MGDLSKMMVPFWVLNIIRHLVFWGPKKGTIILTTTPTFFPGLLNSLGVDLSLQRILNKKALQAGGSP